MEKQQFLTSFAIAHRGLHEKFPENSLSAFRAAIEGGYAIETDVRLTKDEKLVLMHDDNLKRMCGIDKPVAECTLKQLSTLRLSGSDEKIPTLSELLQLVNGRVPLLIEIKTMQGFDSKAYIQSIANAMKDYSGEYAVQSFYPFYIRTYKKLCPNVPGGVLAISTTTREDFHNAPLWKLQAYLVRHMSFNFYVKPDFVSYCASDLPRRATDRFKGIRLAWTIRSTEEELRIFPHVDNIIFEDFAPELFPKVKETK
jgi:glycerophosphoryl diester phosphodiesterase